MDLDFFKKALKYNAPLTIISVVVIYLLYPIFSSLEFLSQNPIISSAVFIIAINALVLIVFHKRRTRHINDGINNNTITKNTTNNIKILSKKSISHNKINNNKCENDIIIGQDMKNEK